MADTKFVFDLGEDSSVRALAQGIALHLPYLASSIEDIDEGVVEQAIESLISDIIINGTKQ